MRGSSFRAKARQRNTCMNDAVRTRHSEVPKHSDLRKWRLQMENTSRRCMAVVAME